MTKFWPKRTKNEFCQGERNPFLDDGIKNEHMSENYEHLMHGFEEIGEKLTILASLCQNGEILAIFLPKMNFARVNETHF